MRLLCTLLILLLFSRAVAQGEAPDSILMSKPDKVQIGHYLIFKTGALLKGCESCLPFEAANFTASAESGIRVGREISIGGGFGFNSFHGIHSVPVFGNFSLNFGKKSQVITGLRLGGSKITRYEDAYGDYGLKRRNGGRLFEPYMGYMIAYHDLRIYFLAGYLKQRFRVQYEYPNYLYINGVLTEFEPSTRDVITDLRRLSLTVGVGWK
jgi:hypothetical protein